MADEQDEDTVIVFTPSYHLEWLLGPNIEIVFEEEDDQE
jgi:hypothetical protein